MALSIESLISSVAADQVRDTMYGILTSLGFPVTSWRPGAISRTIISLIANVFAPFTTMAVVVAKSGFLDFAEGDALRLLAQQFFNVTRIEETFATGEVTLVNTGVNVYAPSAFEWTFQCSLTGKTYTNTDAFSLGASATTTVAIQALEIGSSSSAAPTEVDTTLTANDVTCSNAASVVGLDREEDPALRVRCRAKLDALSANGPAAAYDFVAKTPELNGGVTVTRTNTIHNSDTGEVTLYIAGPSGAVAGGVVTSVQTGIDTWCVPVCTEATVVSASNVTVPVTSTVYIYASENVASGDIQAATSQALTAYFPTIPIGGHVGDVWKESLLGAIAKANPRAYRVSVSGADVALAVNQVAVLGTVTTNVVQVSS